jgi:hypothetical protein
MEGAAADKPKQDAQRMFSPAKKAKLTNAEDEGEEAREAEQVERRVRNK